MSYDIYFFEGVSRSIDRSSFLDYFGNRNNWSVHEEYDQACYQNSDTGVYFLADFVETDADCDEEVRTPYITFNINYFRPPVFGLEAAIEIAEFQRKFAASFFDPQNSGMGSGDAIHYTDQGFLTSYNAGNKCGYRAFGEQFTKTSEDLPLQAPDKKTEEAWRWNYFCKPALYEEYEQAGIDAFVATVLWAKSKENLEAETFAVWTDGARSAIPAFVDNILLYSSTIQRPVSFFSALFRKKPTDGNIYRVQLDDVAKLSCVSRKSFRGKEYLHLESDIDNLSAEVLAFFRQDRSVLSTSEFQAKSADSVLSMELMHAALEEE